MIQGFIIKSYSKNCNANDNINLARQLMFTTGLKTMEGIPPTLHALYQHVCSLLVSAFRWSTCLVSCPEIPDPADWGWIWNPRLECRSPHWVDLPDATEGVPLLLAATVRRVVGGTVSVIEWE